jgi:hypothetical protein
MPCYRCGARQTDPEHGPSPWKRGVVREHQVLVCPACQSGADWTAGLQSCARCGSRHLIRRLDQIECLDCRLIRDALPQEAVPQEAVSQEAVSRGAVPQDALAAAEAASRDPSLADEVARALRRVLGPVLPARRVAGTGTGDVD